MHFLVFGASGAIGRLFCEVAVKEDHNLTIFVRNAAKLPEPIRHNTAIEVVEGTLESETTLEKISKCGAKTFVSFAGPPIGSRGTPLTDGYKLLLPKLVNNGFERILILCTPSFHVEQDKPGFKWRAGEWFMKVFSPGQLLEMISVGKFVTSLPDDERMRCTLFRVGGLTDEGEKPVEATHLGSGKDGVWISRGSVARWTLDEISNRNWIGKVPYICNK